MERSITSATDKIARFLAYLSGAAMVLLVIVLVGNAILSQLGTPYRATYEVVSALGVIVGGMALAEAQVHKAHIAIDLLMKRTSKYVQLFFGTVITVTLLILFAYLAWGFWAYADLQRNLNAATDQLEIPIWVLIMPLFIGFLGLVLALIGDLGRISHAARDKGAELTIW
jgi:TRAP-type C4-dicarboxylate transport system permease small subunit